MGRRYRFHGVQSFNYLDGLSRVVVAMEARCEA